MKVLILGGGGMLGHELWRRLQKQHDVWVTLRRPAAAYAQYGLFEAQRVHAGIDATHFDSIASVVRSVKPQAIVNCIGIIKQLKEAHNPVLSITVNSLLPHHLAGVAGETGSRLVHISTDCVFSGHKGGYVEEDVADPEDLYGRTKLLGEVDDQPHCVTLRTSIIGRELESRVGLIEWFLSQRDQTIRGFRRAIYTGLTTPVLSRVVEDVLLNQPTLSGLWHVSSDPINKYDLLCLAQTAFDWAGRIVPDDTFVCDRSLNSTRFRKRTGFNAPSWGNMLSELAATAR